MSEFEPPETRYAVSGDVHIAYQVMGEGPLDVILVPGIVSHLEFLHEFPEYVAFLRRLATFARVIAFDKRGQGLSDRVSEAPTLEQRVDDVRAVMDEVGSDRAALIGVSEGSALSAFFAASKPARVSKLVLFGGFAKSRLMEGAAEQVAASWGKGHVMARAVTSGAADAELMKQLAKLERLSASPGAIQKHVLLNGQIDVTAILPNVRVPTLVLHRRGDAMIAVERGRALAALIPEARYIEYPGAEHSPFAGDAETVLGDIQEFLTGEREAGDPDVDRTLATVLFTDIVESTRSAVAMGDQRWRRMLDSHDRIAKQLIDRHRGRFVKSTGDGVLATFDGPGRAVRCALAFEAASQQIGLPLRAGVHTGEIELRGQDVGGVAVHVAARVMSHCAPGEVLVSRVVTDLVAGAGLKFADRGAHAMKGLPGTWELYAASL